MDDRHQHVLLLHGMGCGPWVWRDVLPFLSTDLVVHPVVIAGHRGGTRLERRADRTVPEQMVDDLEAQLDRLGIQRLHVVGNSLGGWLALRLAERGRALSVLCLAPAGGWHAGSYGERLIVARFALGRRAARRLIRTPSLLHQPRVRRAVLAPVAHHPERVGADDAATFVHDLVDCEALRVAICHPEARRLGLIRAPGVPVSIAWSANDRVLSGAWARNGFRHLAAEVSVVRDVGHLPMLDDPALVARLIEQRMMATRRAS